MSRKGQSITLSVSERDKIQLEALALEFGKTWGDRPNISKLIEAIARGQLRIAPNHDWSQTRIKALDIARQELLDLGKTDEAREIAQLLSDRNELTLPFRAEIERFLSNPLPAWRQKIDNFIHRQQPFRLSYRDATDRLWHYTILHAHIVPVEKRQYLMCRCEESEGNQDIPGLQHNWTLLLDRIEDAAVISIDQAWLPDLAAIPVEFHLSGRLAFNYRRKQDDEEVSEPEGDPPIKRVIRNISNTFWFFREISAYWEDCEIVSPDSVRDRFLQELKSICQQYGLETRD
jgi:predicted DNA-binding transcriptional regulator YafY